MPGNIDFKTQTLISLSIAVAIGWYARNASLVGLKNLTYHIFGGGLLVGFIGFVLGFFGPIIFSNANQGPLLGIFFTGPLGLIIGGLSGFIIWIIKTKE